MKNFFKIFLILFFGLFSNIQAYACDALNIEIGTKISKVTNYLDFIQEDLLIESDDEDSEEFETTFKFRDHLVLAPGIYDHLVLVPVVDCTLPYFPSCTRCDH